MGNFNDNDDLAKRFLNGIETWDIETFQKEIRKKTYDDSIYDFSNQFRKPQRKEVISYLLEAKNKEDWTMKDLMFVETYLNFSFQELFNNEEKDDSTKKLKDTYFFILENTRNDVFMENALYNAMTHGGSLRHKNNFDGINARNNSVEVCKEIISHLDKNKVRTINFSCLFEQHNPSPEFWFNVGGIGEAIASRYKIKDTILKDGYEAYRNILKQPLTLIEETNSNGQITDMLPIVKMVVGKFKKEQGVNIIIQRTSFEKDIKLYAKKENSSRSLLTFDSIYKMLPFIDAMDEFSLKNTLKQTLPMWQTGSDSQNNRQTKETMLTLQDLFTDKVINYEALKEAENDETLSHNLFLLASEYTAEQLFTEGRFERLLKSSGKPIEDILCSSEALRFLFEHRDIDLSIYGLNKDTPKVLENVSKFWSTSFLPELKEAYPNNEFRHEKGDTPLHHMVSTAKFELVQEMVMSYPEFNSVPNDKNKLPIELVLSKLKVCKTNDKIKIYGKMFESLVSFPLETPKEKILKIYNDCAVVKNKIETFVPGWEQIIQKNLISATIGQVSKATETVEINNEWKI